MNHYASKLDFFLFQVIKKLIAHLKTFLHAIKNFTQNRNSLNRDVKSQSRLSTSDEIKKLYEMNLVIFNKMSNNVFMAKRLSLSN